MTPSHNLQSNTPQEERIDEQRLSLVDHLLRTAPLVLPHPEFADRVMIAIRERELATLNRYTALGIILGLAAVVVVVVLFLAGVGVTLANIVFNWTAFYQNIVLGLGMLSTLSGEGLDSLNQTAQDSPLMLGLGALSLPLLWLWWRVMKAVVVEGDA